MENIFFIIQNNQIDKLQSLDLTKYKTFRNLFGQNALIFACENNQTNIIKYLLRYGIFNLADQDKTGNTALNYAEKNNNLELILLLKDYHKNS